MGVTQISRLSVASFNVIKFTITSLILTPLIEYVLSKVMIHWATISILNGNKIRWVDSKLGPFSLHGKHFRGRSRKLLYFISFISISASLLLEYAFDSQTVVNTAEGRFGRERDLNWLLNLSEEVSTTLRQKEMITRRVAESVIKEVDFGVYYEYGDSDTEKDRARIITSDIFGDYSIGYLGNSVFFDELSDLLGPNLSSIKTREISSALSIELYVLGYLKMQTIGGESHFRKPIFQRTLDLELKGEYKPVHARRVTVYKKDGVGCVTINGDDSRGMCLETEGNSLFLYLANGTVLGPGDIEGRLLVRAVRSHSSEIDAGLIMAQLMFDPIARGYLINKDSNFVAEEEAELLRQIAMSFGAVLSGIRISDVSELVSLKFRNGTRTIPILRNTQFLIAFVVLVSILFGLLSIKLYQRASLRKIHVISESGEKQRGSDIVIGDDVEYLMRLLASEQNQDGLCHNPSGTDWGLIIKGGAGRQHLSVGGGNSEPFCKPIHGVDNDIPARKDDEHVV